MCYLWMTAVSRKRGRLTTGDLALRIFGHRAQKLQQIAEKIKEIYTSCQINHKSVMNE